MRVVLGRLEAARIDIERTIDQSESRTEWRGLVRSVLVHWLGELFTEGMGHTKDLQTSLDIARRQIESQKQLISDLQDEVQILRDKQS